MKSALSLLTIFCLVVSSAGQSPSPAKAQTVEVDPIANDLTIKALTALLESKRRAAYAESLVSSGNFAALADKELLLRIKAEADRPNYGGNAYAKIRGENLWMAILDGRAQPPPEPPAKAGE